HHRLQCRHQACLPAPWPMDTAREGHEAPSRPAGLGLPMTALLQRRRRCL
ncbi:hypothetical protein NDU88_000711, partial [Pleurodeles waltl]